MRFAFARLRLSDSLVEPSADDELRLTHDAVDQFLAGGDVVDQALGLSRRPDAGVGVAAVVDLRAARAGDQLSHVLELRIAAALDGDDLVADLVLRDARGV